MFLIKRLTEVNTTYYEILGVSTTATTAEIEAACEARYNHWRRLVTHHDPEVANKANQALRWLEKIRATLGDPARRAAYDVSIELPNEIGGLADPQAGPTTRTATPPRPKPRESGNASPRAATPRVDAWVCSECQTANAAGTRFCEKCGHQMGQDCPSCGHRIKSRTSFCPECGIDIEAVHRQRRQERLQELQTQIQEQQVALQNLEQSGRKFIIFPWPKDKQLLQSIWKSTNRNLHLTAVLILLGASLVLLFNQNLCFGVVLTVPTAMIIALYSYYTQRAEVRRRIQSYGERIAGLEREIKQIENSRG